MTRAMEHLNNQHVGMSGHIIDEKPQYRKDFLAMQSQCFPPETGEANGKEEWLGATVSSAGCFNIW